MLRLFQSRKQDKRVEKKKRRIADEDDDDNFVVCSSWQCSIKLCPSFMEILRKTFKKKF